ncbi:MAG: hypothetical protein GEU98_11725 [Pseudonocardiaceae bacterium]|nr:hypothetical protein [Pseudonocardiaceae bacterium]
METWRIFATALLGTGGIVLVLVTMAQVRERRNSSTAQVAISGAVAFTLLVVIGLLVATVLPAAVAWTTVAVVGAIAGLLVLID